VETVPVLAHEADGHNRQMDDEPGTGSLRRRPSAKANSYFRLIREANVIICCNISIT
jgi:hypothetical protein